jgi:SAM-dependent methyltransferase
MAMKPQKKIDPFQSQYAEIAATGLPASARSTEYSQEETQDVPAEAVELGLGCGNPTALAMLRQGQTVVDLGCGAGLDAFIAARKVGPQGRVIGIDMTPEMVAKGNQVAKEGGFHNVEFRVGRLESLPLPDDSIDVAISNCALNHATDKRAAFREARRVLRPGGLLLVSDLVVKRPLPLPDSPGLEVWREWLSVACGKDEYLAAMEQAGFANLRVVREHPYAGQSVPSLLSGKIVSLELRARK